MNLINCSTDCVYQKDGYCCLDVLSEVESAPIAGCHYYKKTTAVDKQNPPAPPPVDEIDE